MLIMGLGFVGYAVAGNFIGLALATVLVAIGQRDRRFKRRLSGKPLNFGGVRPSVEKPVLSEPLRVRR